MHLARLGQAFQVGQLSRLYRGTKDAGRGGVNHDQQDLHGSGPLQ